MQEQIIVGLDIGTSKIACTVAKSSCDGMLTIIGVGTHHSTGLRRGMVVNPERTIASIRLAVEEAELMADVEIKQVYVGIAGSHIQGRNSHGVVATKTQKVTAEDIQRVIESAQAWHIPANQKILHIIPQEYKIDAQGDIRDPIGMCGVRLEARVHIVTADMYAMQNIINCCNRCDLDIANIVVEQIASSEAVLSQDEKDIGVLLVDIGGGTTDLAVFMGGSICHTAVIPIGGDHLTYDLVAGLGTSSQVTDRLKIKYGACLSSIISEDDMIEVPQVGGRTPKDMPRQIMAQLLEPRVRELFTLIQDEIIMFDYQNKIVAGVVFTGGSSLLEGTLELADEMFEMPVRLARPQGVNGLIDVVSSPIFSTAVGLVKYGYKNRAKLTVEHVYPSKLRKIYLKFLHWLGA